MYVIMDVKYERVQIEHDVLPCVMSGKNNFRSTPVKYTTYLKALRMKLVYWDVKIVPLELFNKLQGK